MSIRFAVVVAAVCLSTLAQACDADDGTDGTSDPQEPMGGQSGGGAAPLAGAPGAFSGAGPEAGGGAGAAAGGSGTGAAGLGPAGSGGTGASGAGAGGSNGTAASGAGGGGSSGAAAGGAGAGGSGGAAAGGAGGGSGTGASGAGAGGGGGQGCTGDDCVDPEPCNDNCPYPDGVEWVCKLRFMYGINYAWHHFAGDFGGISQWNQQGVSGNPAVETDLADLAENGVNAIRWWLWPDFRGDGVTFDDDDNPTGLGQSVPDDLAAALELADRYDLYLMLTLFSFDNFRPARDEAGIFVRGITSMVLDDTKRQMLMDNVVAPFARQVAESPYAQRVIAWDVINEPEWAISGAGLYGDDQPFDPMTELDTVSHEQMETFVRDVITALRSESDALISVGGAAIKWRHAWSNVDTDFHQFHIYDWVDQYWPYTNSPSFYEVDDKPVVMGEFPGSGLSGATYLTVVESWFGNGYAGALGWAYTDGMRGNLTEVKRFADSHACQTQY